MVFIAVPVFAEQITPKFKIRILVTSPPHCGSGIWGGVQPGALTPGLVKFQPSAGWGSSQRGAWLGHPNNPDGWQIDFGPQLGALILMHVSFLMDCMSSWYGGWLPSEWVTQETDQGKAIMPVGGMKGLAGISIAFQRKAWAPATSWPPLHCATVGGCLSLSRLLSSWAVSSENPMTIMESLLMKVFVGSVFLGQRGVSTISFSQAVQNHICT